MPKSEILSVQSTCRGQAAWEEAWEEAGGGVSGRENTRMLMALMSPWWHSFGAGGSAADAVAFPGVLVPVTVISAMSVSKEF